MPALNEESLIECSLLSVLRQSEETELIVVDGGSTDGTLSIARKHARLVSGPACRSSQMNLGAAHATGDVLLFLHADTRLNPDHIREVLRALEDPDVIGGCSPLVFDSAEPFLSLYSRLSMMRFWLFHYGDGALFMRRSAFDRLCGFKEIPIMEDLDFLRRMRWEGKTVLLETPVITSARRFRRKGAFIGQLRNVILVLSYLLGVPAGRLVRWYPHIRE